MKGKKREWLPLSFRFLYFVIHPLECINEKQLLTGRLLPLVQSFSSLIFKGDAVKSARTTPCITYITLFPTF